MAVRSLLRAIVLLGLMMAGCPLWAGPAEVTSPSASHHIRMDDFFPQARSTGSSSEFSMTVGTVTEDHRTTAIAPGEFLRGAVKTPRPGDTLLVVLVVPDDSDSHQYDLELSAGNQVFHRRSGQTRGFGRRSFFVPLPSCLTGAADLSLSLQNRSREPLYLAGLSLLRGFEARLAASPPPDFTLSLLINDLRSTELLKVAEGLPDVPGVRKALCSEVYYVAFNEAKLRAQMETAAGICRERELSFLPCLCSWWAGTPAAVKSRIDFQQICWSATDDYDEGPALRELLGEKWDLRYGLTVPNKWSNTPWQTMNSPELNRLRHRKLDQAVRLIESTVQGAGAGYVVENEPAYWAFEGSDNKYPVRRQGLWADFNPQTVAQAKQEGVELNPADGLDLVERAWLLRNVAHYNQATVDVITSVAVERPVYSHALLDYNQFPFAGTGRARSYAEAARIRGARTGVEIIWKTDLDALWRLREWGPWGCVNREEWDGYGLDYHLGTLRACYMMGADLVNSYNWQLMGREGDPLEYFGVFLDDLARGRGSVTVGERSSGREWKPVRQWGRDLAVRSGSPWVNAIELTLRCRGTSAPLDIRLRNGAGGSVAASRLLSPEDLSSSGPTIIRFGDLALIEQDQGLLLELDGGGGSWEMLGSYWGPNYRLLCDLKEERVRSCFITGGLRLFPGQEISVPEAVTHFPLASSDGGR